MRRAHDVDIDARRLAERGIDAFRRSSRCATRCAMAASVPARRAVGELSTSDGARAVVDAEAVALSG
jgi:hypothetical protein